MYIYLNTFVVALASCIWSATYYLNSSYVEGHIRPYAYRVLVPALAGGLELLGLRFDLGLILIMTLSGVGFYLSLRVLASEFTVLDVRQELGILVGVLVSMTVFGFYRKTYDLMTALLFTLALYYIWKVYTWKYLAVFILACLNRETAFLLIIISAVIWFPILHNISQVFDSNWLQVFLGQIGIFAITAYAIRHRFADYPGYPLLIDPVGNLHQLASHPYQFILGIFAVSVMMAWMFRKPQPKFLQLSFLILFPILTVMWLVCGQVFEIRVFWEISPVVILLMVL